MAYDASIANVSLLLHMDGANNSTTFLDFSPTPGIVSVAGDAKISTTQSKFGGASLYLDGTGDYLLLDGNADLALGAGDFTIELWEYCTSLSAARVLFDFRPVSTDGAYPYAYIDGTNIVYRLNNADRITAAHGISANTWVHIAIVRSAGVTKIYINGTALGTTYSDSTSLLVGTGRPVIGAAGSTLGAFPFIGYIDDLRITKGVARYTANFSVPTETFPDRGPRVVGTILDSSGNPASRTVRAYRRDTGALLGSAVPRDTAGDVYRRFVSLMLHADGANNSTTFTDTSPTPLTVTTSGNAKISTAQSKFGGSSLAFDGTGDYLNANYNAAFDLLSPVSAFTVEAWVYATSLNSAGSRIFALGGGAVAWNSTNGIHLLIQVGSGKVDVQMATGTGSPITTSTTASVSTGAWTHIAVSYSLAAGKLYVGINGTVQEFTVSAPTRPSTNPTLQIGTIPGEAGASPYAWNGYMDDIRITKGVARYTSSFTPHTVAHPDYDTSASLNEYVIETGTYTGEVNVICLDDDAGTLENDLIHRAIPA